MKRQRGRRVAAAVSDKPSMSAVSRNDQFFTFTVPKKTIPRGTIKVWRNWSCESCGSVTTPERRYGPSGRNTLCNACGLKYAKTQAHKRLKDGEEEELDEEKKKVRQVMSVETILN